MIYIILAMLLYAMVIMFGAVASRHASANLVAAVIATFSALMPLAITMPFLSKKSLQNQKFGIMMAVIAGIIVSLFVIALNKSYAQNKVGIVAPVVFGGAIFISTVLSYFILKEKISQLQLTGLIFLATGFGMIIYARAFAK